MIRTHMRIVNVRRVHGDSCGVEQSRKSKGLQKARKTIKELEE